MKYIFKKRYLIALMSVVDAAGYLAGRIFRVLFRLSVKDGIKKVLLIRADHIGDVVLSTVCIKPLSERFPDTEIDFLVAPEAREIVSAHSRIGNVIDHKVPWFDREHAPGLFGQIRGVVELAKVIRRGGYDIVIDMRGDFRNILSMFLSGVKRRISYGITGGGFLLTDETVYRQGAHETEHDMDLLTCIGVEKKKGIPFIEIDTESAAQAESMMARDNIPGVFAALHFAPGHATKKWDADRFFEILKHMAFNIGIACIIVGTEKDRNAYPVPAAEYNGMVFDLRGKTGIGGLCAVLKKARFFAGVDSAPAHIAAVFDVPSVIIFSGINDPGQWAPRGEKIHLVYPGKGKDLSGITADEVCRAIDKALDSKQ